MHPALLFVFHSAEASTIAALRQLNSSVRSFNILKLVLNSLYRFLSFGGLSRVSATAALLLLPALASCDRIKEAVSAGEAPDVRWQGDSTLLASRPNIVFRIVPSGDTAAMIVPMATMSPSGARELRLSRRGWAAFDLSYLQSSSPIIVTRNGKATTDLRSHRGFYEPTALDTSLVNACRPGTPIPFAFGRLSGSMPTLATSGPPTPLKYTSSLNADELREALEAIPLLIAPPAGIATSQLQRYERRVHQVPSAAGEHPTIIVSYDDPEVPADSLVPMTERPRHFLVVLDKGIYGYKPSWTYKSLGNSRDVPRLQFLDALDVNGDGLVELFFGIRGEPRLRNTRVLRYDADAWREVMSYSPRTPCAF